MYVHILCTLLINLALWQCSCNSEYDSYLWLIISQAMCECNLPLGPKGPKQERSCCLCHRYVNGRGSNKKSPGYSTFVNTYRTPVVLG